MIRRNWSLGVKKHMWIRVGEHFMMQYSGHLYFMTNRLRITYLKIIMLAIKYAASVLKREIKIIEGGNVWSKSFFLFFSEIWKTKEVLPKNVYFFTLFGKFVRFLAITASFFRFQQLLFHTFPPSMNLIFFV